MAKSEQSFADRLGRARTMAGAITGFQPPYNPGETTITITAFGEHLTATADANQKVSVHSDRYRAEAKERRDIIATIKTRSLLVLSYCNSVAALASYVPTVKTKVYKIRGYRLPRKDKPTPPPPESGDPATPPDEPGTRSTGEQSYSEIYELFKGLNAHLESIPAYAPTNASIGIQALDTLAMALNDKNESLVTIDNTLTVARLERKELFDGPEGLRVRMLRIKQAVRSQYTSESTQYKAIKSIQP